jgi:iron(III) transport system permease protein
LFAIGYWLARGNSSTLPPASVWQATVTTLGYSVIAAVVATVAAVPVALYAWRCDNRLARGIERAAFLGRAVPGIAVALAVVYFGIRFAQPL